MSVRRLVSVLSVCLVASVTVVVAQPAKKKTPVAPAKETGSGSGSARLAGSAAGSAAAAGSGAEEGSAVQMVEDPPADMEGTNENPDAPRGTETTTTVAAVPEKKRTSGYPMEEALRPITLPANMSEVSVGVRAPLSPFNSTGALRARYGVTRQAQLGLSYALFGVYDDPGTVSTKKAIHPGKAVGLDVTVLLQDWIGVKVGVPLYFDPVAIGLTIGAPLKFRFGDKVALGGMDDLINISLYRFQPSFEAEVANAVGKANFENNTTQSRGSMRFSAYGIYQVDAKMAIIGRLGLVMDDFATTRGNTGYGGLATYIRGGIQYTVRKFFDVGGSLGFDDLAHGGSFAPAAYLNLRI